MFPFGQDIAWKPDAATVEGTNLAAFWKSQCLEDYETLRAWALEDVGRFWGAVIEDIGIVWEKEPDEILDTSEGGLERPSWCGGGRMNVVDSMLTKWLNSPVADQDAIRYESEEGTVVRLTYRELDQRVSLAAAALRANGIGKGDAVGLYMPLIPELVIAFLAVIKVGGIVLPLFSGYGSEAVATRLRDADAKALFVSDGLVRRGKTLPMKPTADKALESCPTVETVIVQPRCGLDVEMTAGRDLSWSDFIRSGMGADDTLEKTEDTAAEDPLMIIYTSGTTGRPKGAVHTHCGFPIKAAQDMRHPMDLKQGDAMWWMTDMGWMMGPWLAFGTLLNGATMVLFDGAPDTPDVDRVWQISADHQVTLLGVSPTLIRALMPHGTESVDNHDLSALRAVGSTGSPWDPVSWKWLFRNVLDEKKPILNYSGGTEISGGIVCGNFVEPLKPCGFSGAVIGMDADVVDDSGNPLRGGVGELVLRQPWIGMTRGFWRDEARYHETYWSKIPGLWVHGDYAAIDDDGIWYILGRSDDTIKVAGKRLGPAEVEAVLNEDDRVVESAAIGVPDDVKGEALVAFAVLNVGTEPNETLREELRERLVAALGKALAPKSILFAAGLPKTRNAKVMRRVIRAAYLGKAPGDVTSLEDPQTLEMIRQAS